MKLVAAGGRVFISRVVQVLANAAVVMVVASTLGPQLQGYYSLTMAVALLLASILAGGQGLAAVPVFRQEQVPPGRIVRAQLLWIGTVTVLLAGAMLLTLRPPPAAFLTAHLGWRPGLGFIVLVAVAGILVFEVFSYDLLARGRLVVGAVVNGIRASAHLAAVALAALAGALTFGKAVGLAAAAQAAGGIMVLTILGRELAGPGRTRRPPATMPGPAAAVPAGGAPLRADLSPVGLTAALARRGWVGQLSGVAYFLLLRLDQGILAYFRGAAEVGIYSVAVYVSEMLWLLPGALTPLLVHSSAGNEDPVARDRTALQAVRLGVAVTLGAAIPLYLAAGPLLAWLAGGAYAESGLALRALLPGIVTFAPGAVLAGDFIGRGKPHWNTQASVVTLGVNVLAALWLIPAHGAVGAGWASSIAYTCGSLVMIGRFLRVIRLPLRALLLGP